MIGKRARQILTAAAAVSLIFANSVGNSATFAAFAAEARKTATDAFSNKTDPAGEGGKGSAGGNVWTASPAEVDKPEIATPGSAGKLGDSSDSRENSDEVELIDDLAGETEKTGFWIKGDNSGKTYDKLQDAVSAATKGATVCMAGEFDDSAVGSAVVVKNITLEVAGDTTIESHGDYQGISLADNAKLTCGTDSSGNMFTLTMKNFACALMVSDGAEINDGNYVFSDNGIGIVIDGKVEGSDPEKLVITADDKDESDFYRENATFTNCTINVHSQEPASIAPKPLKLNNALMTLSGFSDRLLNNTGDYFYPFSFVISDGKIVNHSELHLASTEGGNGPIAFWGGETLIDSSTIQIDSGSSDGIFVSHWDHDEDWKKSTSLTIKNSTLNLYNDGCGLFAFEDGDVNIENSIINRNAEKADGEGSLPELFHVQGGAKIIFTGDCCVNAPDYIGFDPTVGGKGYIVKGGSFHMLAYDYPNSWTPYNPGNGYGDKLSLFTLSKELSDYTNDHPLTLLDTAGNAYEYSVKLPSSDDKKHVFAPMVIVNFVSQEDSTEAKYTRYTMRGYALDDCTSEGIPDEAKDGEGLPEPPEGKGWFYKDKDGQEQVFDGTTPVTEDTTVYAKNCEVVKNSLEADLLMNDDTGSGQVLKVSAGKTAELAMALDVAPIIEQINAIVNRDSSIPNIKNFGFQAVLSFPDGIELPETLTAADVILENGGGLKITEAQKSENGRKVTVMIGPEDSTDPVKCDQLVELLEKAGKDSDSGERWITIRIPNVTVKKKGTVEGSVTVQATASGTDKTIFMQWTAEQWPDGIDAAHQDDVKKIYYTVDLESDTKPTEPVEPMKPSEPTKPAEPATPSEIEHHDHDHDRGSDSAGNSGHWDYFDPEKHDWHFIDSTGKMIKDTWAKVSTTVGKITRSVYYSFDSDGDMRTGWYKDPATEKWYYLSKEHDGWFGSMQTGWHYDKEDGHWYYLNPDGAMQTGWQLIDGKWYYLTPSNSGPTWSYDETEKTWVYTNSQGRPLGSMYQGEKTPDGYTVDENGAWENN
jgi:glucan-binding YG repeat protein